MNCEIVVVGLELVGWCKVLIDISVFGCLVLECLLQIEQVFIGGVGLSDQDFVIKLFSVWCCLLVVNVVDSDYYICSFLYKIIIYKGLMMLVDLVVFYLDFGDECLQIVICVFYQCFFINILLKWLLVQFFCFFVYNGEINIIIGNCNWVQVWWIKFINELIFDLEELGLLVNCVGFDLLSMDNMFELMVIGGMDLFCGLCMIILLVWQNVEIMDVDLCVFYEYNLLYMEFWDGFVGVVLIDGCYVVCLFDCNGLCLLCWVIMKNGYIILVLEIGVWDYKFEDVIVKGCVGLGQIFVVDIEIGQVLYSDDIDNCLKLCYFYK